MSDDGMAVQANDLHKAYGAHPVLAGVDIQLRRGAVLALLGRNGAGKTTTVRILATLLRADSGRARVAGRLRGLGAASARARARDLLARFDLVAAGSRRVSTDSGGRRRRLELAM